MTAVDNIKTYFESIRDNCDDMQDQDLYEKVVGNSNSKGLLTFNQYFVTNLPAFVDGSTDYYKLSFIDTSSSNIAAFGGESNYNTLLTHYNNIAAYSFEALGYMESYE